MASDGAQMVQFRVLEAVPPPTPGTWRTQAFVSVGLLIIIYILQEPSFPHQPTRDDAVTSGVEHKHSWVFQRAEGRLPRKRPWPPLWK